jgi:anti-sigma factor RsiW
MTHFDCGNIAAYYDGELDPAGTAEAAAHLAGCPACRAELAELKAVDAALASGGEPDISGRVMAAIRRRAAPPRPLFAGWWKVPAIALASCGLYVLFVETGLWPPGRASSLAALLSARGETEELRALLPGQSEKDASLLAMVLEGDVK